MEKASPGGRFLPLDVLRSVAILLVLAKHSIPLLQGLQERMGPARDLSYHLAEVVHRGGWVGVDLFFVLSGFLVSGLLFREYQSYGSVWVGRFLIRRGFKIYPAFYVFIAYTVLFHFPGASRWALYSEVFFVQNYFHGLWDHTWSLAIEEHFYLFIALVVYFRTRLRGDEPATFDFIPKLFLLLGSTMLVARLLNSAFFDFSLRTHHFPTLVRMDSLMFGVLVSYYYNFYHDRFVAVCTRHRRLLLLAGTALLVPPFVFDQWQSTHIETVGLAGIYLGSGMLLSGFMVGSFPRNALTVLLGKIGSYSYSIYLWHIAARDWMWDLAEALEYSVAPGVMVVLYVATSLVVGVLTALAVEFPVLRLRDRFFPSRSAGAV